MEELTESELVGVYEFISAIFVTELPKKSKKKHQKFSHVHSN